MKVITLVFVLLQLTLSNCYKRQFDYFHNNSTTEVTEYLGKEEVAVYGWLRVSTPFNTGEQTIFKLISFSDIGSGEDNHNQLILRAAPQDNEDKFKLIFESPNMIAKSPIIVTNEFKVPKDTWIMFYFSYSNLNNQLSLMINHETDFQEKRVDGVFHKHMDYSFLRIGKENSSGSAFEGEIKLLKIHSGIGAFKTEQFYNLNFSESEMMLYDSPRTYSKIDFEGISKAYVRKPLKLDMGASLIKSIFIPQNQELIVCDPSNITNYAAFTVKKSIREFSIDSISNYIGKQLIEINNNSQSNVIACN